MSTQWFPSTSEDLSNFYECWVSIIPIPYSSWIFIAVFALVNLYLLPPMRMPRMFNDRTPKESLQFYFPSTLIFSFIINRGYRVPCNRHDTKRDHLLIIKQNRNCSPGPSSLIKSNLKNFWRTKIDHNYLFQTRSDLEIEMHWGWLDWLITQLLKTRRIENSRDPAPPL